MKRLDRDMTAGTRARGAALVLATAAAAVVMLSALLLIGYLGRMNDAQTSRENAAQADLSTSSASDWLACGLAGGGVAPADLDGAVFESGGLTTEIELISSAPVSPATVQIPGTSGTDCEAVPSDGRVSVLSFDGGACTFDVFDIDSGTMERHVRDVPDPSARAAGTGTGSGYLLALVPAESGHPFGFLAHDGSLALTGSVDLPFEWSAAEAGLVDGVPAVVLYSDSGATLVVSSDGSVRESEEALQAALDLASGGPAVTSGGSTRDVFRCDIDMDGRPDIVLVGSGIVVCYSAAGSREADSLPGMRPSVWGFSEVSSGLVVRWDGDSGCAWRRFGWSGFSGFTPPPALSNHGWTGRIVEGSNCVSGAAPGGMMIVSCSSGASGLLGDGAPLFADIDGGGLDALVWSDDGLAAVMDPLEGEGTGTLWRLVTRSGNEELRVDTLACSIYTDASGNVSVAGGIR